MSSRALTRQPLVENSCSALIQINATVADRRPNFQDLLNIGPQCNLGIAAYGHGYC